MANKRAGENGEWMAPSVNEPGLSIFAFIRTGWLEESFGSRIDLYAPFHRKRIRVDNGDRNGERAKVKRGKIPKDPIKRRTYTWTRSPLPFKGLRCVAKLVHGFICGLFSRSCCPSGTWKFLSCLFSPSFR